MSAQATPTTFVFAAKDKKAGMTLRDLRAVLPHVASLPDAELRVEVGWRGQLQKLTITAPEPDPAASIRAMLQGWLEGGAAGEVSPA